MRHPTLLSFFERFWARVEKTDYCWKFTGSLNTYGYGSLKRGQETIAVHRYSWEQANGPVPPGLWVLHKCDVRNCVRPSHLWLGTAKDNTQDALRKGRLTGGDTRGERNSNAKLSDAAVRAIRKMKADRVPIEVIARRFGVERQSVYRVLNGKGWTHVT